MEFLINNILLIKLCQHARQIKQKYTELRSRRKQIYPVKWMQILQKLNFDGPSIIQQRVWTLLRGILRELELHQLFPIRQ